MEEGGGGGGWRTLYQDTVGGITNLHLYLHDVQMIQASQGSPQARLTFDLQYTKTQTQPKL